DMEKNDTMTGTVAILNVGTGDTKLTFDKSNPAECIRAARIIKDMLRRGYALLVELPPKNEGDKPTYQRVTDFREDTYEYIIADLEPERAAADERVAGENVDKRRGRPRKRALDATETRAVTVPH